MVGGGDLGCIMVGSGDLGCIMVGGGDLGCIMPTAAAACASTASVGHGVGRLQ
jgi:hypothetical protein